MKGTLSIWFHCSYAEKEQFQVYNISINLAVFLYSDKTLSLVFDILHKIDEKKDDSVSSKNLCGEVRERNRTYNQT